MEEILYVPAGSQAVVHPKLSKTDINTLRLIEKIRFVPETQEVVDQKLSKTEGPEEGGGGAGEEEEEEEESDEDTEEYGVNDGRWMPYTDIDPLPLCRAGASYTIEEAEKIAKDTLDRNTKLLVKWCDMCNNHVTPLPCGPLQALPKITHTCVTGSYECYHRRYWTGILSPTAPTHPYFRPCGMLQVFSLTLSSMPSRPVKIYGHFAVRDCWEPLCNHLFKRSEDDPATIAPGYSSLPLCSPSRGIYVLQYILVDIDLWIKGENGSADKPLFCGYVELNTSLSTFGNKLKGRIHGECHSLDMHYAFLGNSIESVVEIFVETEHSSEMKIIALTSGFDDEILLYDGAFCGSGAIVRHFIAVELLGELHILLKLDGSLHNWTFQPEVGVLHSPAHFGTDLAKFIVTVSFRTKGKAASTWRWSSICNEVQLMKFDCRQVVLEIATEN